MALALTLSFSQLVDDMLDFTASAAELGKPGGGADLKLGLATAPALYAWEEFPELGAMIERKFSGPDDVERVRFLVSPLLLVVLILQRANRLDTSSVVRQAPSAPPPSPPNIQNWRVKRWKGCPRVRRARHWTTWREIH